MASQRVKDAVIDISASLTTSSVVDLGSNRIFALHIPAAFTGTAVSFEVAPEVDGTYQALYDGGGSEISLTVSQGETIGITGTNAAALAACRFIKIVSDDNEVADRTIRVLLVGTYSDMRRHHATASPPS